MSVIWPLEKCLRRWASKSAWVMVGGRFLTKIRDDSSEVVAILSSIPSMQHVCQYVDVVVRRQIMVEKMSSFEHSEIIFSSSEEFLSLAHLPHQIALVTNSPSKRGSGPCFFLRSSWSTH